MYERAIKYHEDDIAKLLDADVVADCLVSEGVFSSSDREDVISADCKVSCLLERVKEKNAYCNCFSILLQTGEQLPGHGRLWDLLNETCKGIYWNVACYIYMQFSCRCQCSC